MKCLVNKRFFYFINKKDFTSLRAFIFLFGSEFFQQGHVFALHDLVTFPNIPLISKIVFIYRINLKI